MNIKKKELELFLERIPDFSKPKSKFEQYKTPSIIASDILFRAFLNDDIFDKTILDLGCGTGIFAIGAKKLKAKRVVGIDIDPKSIDIASTFAKNHNLNIEFSCMDITEPLSEKFDTVLMNPPFGAQKKNLHADRVFLEKAIKLGSVVYSLHLEPTLDFIKTLIHALDRRFTILQRYNFPMKATFQFHTKLKQTIPIILLQIK
jgi:putative methylase